jgi:hypothetical protein
MKRAIVIILILTSVIICVWLVLRRQISKQINPSQVSFQTTNISGAPVSHAPSSATNAALIQPDTVDKATSDKWVKYRQVVLSENQPIEFYARVIDQNGNPVQGAKLILQLSRMNENEFSMANFPNWNPARAVVNKGFEVFSDSSGWIQVTQTNGSHLAVWGLTKEGYISSYPDGNFGGVSYEPGGRRNPSGDIQMTNAWNPQKGYIFHLQKIGETNSVNSVK